MIYCQILLGLSTTSTHRRKKEIPAISCIKGIKDTMRDRVIDENEWRDRKQWRSKCGMRQSVPKLPPILLGADSLGENSKKRV